jgi:pilus assembly protein CpaB
MARVTGARRAPYLASGRLYVVLAVGLGVVAALLVLAALREQGGAGSGGGGTTAVVVAARDIPARAVITADMTRLEPVPTANVVADVYRDRSAVIGQVTRYPIAAREQIGAQKLAVTTATSAQVGAKAGPSDGLSLVVPPGKRAVGITITEPSAVGGLAIPGDRVDVIVLLNKDLAGIERATTAFQNIEVLSVAQEAQDIVPPPLTASATPPAGAATTADARGIRPADARPQPQARTVTLALTPAQAQLIALAEQHGKIWLSLRPYEEDSTVELGPTDLLPLGALPAERRAR